MNFVLSWWNDKYWIVIVVLFFKCYWSVWIYLCVSGVYVFVFRVWLFYVFFRFYIFIGWIFLYNYLIFVIFSFSNYLSIVGYLYRIYIFIFICFFFNKFINKWNFILEWRLRCYFWGFFLFCSFFLYIIYFSLVFYNFFFSDINCRIFLIF